MTEPHLVDQDGGTFSLAEETTIGRDTGNDIRLDSKKISRRHAVIRRRTSGAYEIEDLGSTQGTVVDGRPILVSTRLIPGSEICIGERRLRFMDGAAMPPDADAAASLLARAIGPATTESPAPTPDTRPLRADPSPGRDTSRIQLAEPEAEVQARVESSASLDLVAASAVVADAELRERYERLRAMVAMAQAMGAEHDLDRLLARVLAFLREQVGAEYGAVLLAARGGGEPVPRVSLGPEGPGAPVLVSRTVLREVLARGVSVLCADAGVDERFGAAASVRAAGLRSVMCVPMRHGDEVVGAVHLHSVGRADAFDRRHLALAATLATQAAMAVRSALAAEAVAEAQAAERRYLRALVRDLPVGLLVLDAAGRCTLANAEAMRVLGAAGCREGEPLAALGPHPLAALLPDLSAEPRELDWPGPPRRVVLATAARLGARQREETMLVLRDVTALRDREAQAQLRERLALVGQLVGGVAHDFNNLLAVVLGYAGAAAYELPPEHPVRTHLAEIHSAGERAATLVKQLLRVGRPGATRPAVVDVDHVVAGMHDMLGRTIGEHVALEHAPGAAPWHVEIDPNRLEQVVLNLVVNARDAIEGPGTIRVATAAVHGPADGTPGAGDWVRLSVADTGAGMPPEVAARIFEPFFTTKPRGRGTGLGLATVAEVAREAAGTVAVASTPGRGTTVTLHFPATRRAATHTIPQELAPPPRGDGELILLVEDEAALRRLLRDVLERAGYRVVEARSAPDALRAMARAPDVAAVLTDVVLPGLSGPALLRAIRETGRDPPVLFMTGYADDALAEHGVDPEGVWLLRKPVSEARLCHALRAVLGSV